MDQKRYSIDGVPLKYLTFCGRRNAAIRYAHLHYKVRSLFSSLTSKPNAEVKFSMSESLHGGAGEILTSCLQISVRSLYSEIVMWVFPLSSDAADVVLQRKSPGMIPDV